MRVAILTLVLVVALSAAASGAAKQPPLKFEGTVWSGPDLAPGGWILAQPERGLVRALSDRDGRSYTRLLPAGCGTLSMRFPRVLLSCTPTGGGANTLAFIDVRTGTVQPIPVAPNPSALCGPV